MPDSIIEFTTEAEKEQIITEQEALGNELKIIHFGVDKKTIHFKTGDDAVTLKKKKAVKELDSIGAAEFELIEEMFDILIAKNVIKLSDLSDKTKDKYEKRKTLKQI